MRKRTRKNIIKSLDDLTRKIVIARDGGRCQWCKKAVEGVQAQCSHVRSRKYYNTRWALPNVKLLCASCHFKWHDDPTAGVDWFNATFPDRHNWIDEMRRRGLDTYRDSDLIDIETGLKQKLKEINE